ncbi:hypothetical protein MASR2M36_24820 [Providencia sp.]
MAKIYNFEIFRTGNFTAMDGRNISFSHSDLSEVADSYNPSVYLAPLTIGHPANNEPRLGEVRTMFVHGNSLYASAEFSDALKTNVKTGTYKNRSASFFMPNTPDNPRPGKFYLRHIGFLGAVPPAVKGMAPIQFAGIDANDEPLNFGTSFDPILFADNSVCDTSARIPVTQPDGTIKYGFLWRGEILYPAHQF